MDAIVNEVSPSTLFTASYEHFRAYELYCAHAPTGEVHDTPELAWGKALAHWINAWGDSYHATDTKRQNRFDFRARQGLDSRFPCRSFLAYLDDQPVATSELFLGAGVAAVVWVGTIPSARGQGLAQPSRSRLYWKRVVLDIGSVH